MKVAETGHLYIKINGKLTVGRKITRSRKNYNNIKYLYGIKFI